MIARKVRAQAAIDQAEALLAKTRIVAPIAGLVVTRSAHPGETLTVGSPIVKLVDLNRIRVEAEVDEYDVGKIALGTTCQIRAEGYLGETWTGTVEEIPAEVVPRRIRPEDPSRPADTRVVTVKVALDQPIPLKLGQRVYVTIRRAKPTPTPEADDDPE
jgi:multidrug resistance efflux pump